jgi:pimeloyl-ACP methyl ester carboxylesterase
MGVRHERAPGTVPLVGDVLEQVIGVLNGALGDYLKRTGNGLSTSMSLVHAGRPLALSADALASAYPDPCPRLVVLVHGLMSTELVWRMPDGHDYGSLLARDLGYTKLLVRYNSGLHVSENGEALDALLEQLVGAYPVGVEEIVLIGHSMGGLVIRSACHAATAARRWLPLARRAFYVGTPHLGVPLERFGNVLAWTLGNLPSPYTRLVADIVNLRSSGIKDLRYANLRREDWAGADADALLQDRRHPVPLLPHIRHHLIASALVDEPHLALLFGDGLVPLDSAAGRAAARHGSAIFPPEHVRVLPSLDHVRLAHHPDVYAIIRASCEEGSCNAGAV